MQPIVKARKAKALLVRRFICKFLIWARPTHVGLGFLPMLCLCQALERGGETNPLFQPIMNGAMPSRHKKAVKAALVLCIRVIKNSDGYVNALWRGLESS